MKKSTYYILIFFSLIIFCIALTACKKNISINLPTDTNKPVLNSFIKHGKIIEVSVSLSKWLAINETFSQLSSAKVQLYENGIFIETLDTATINGRKRFVSKILARKNNKYKIVANVKGYDQLEAEDVVPDIDKIEIKNQSQTEVNSTNGGMFRFDFSIRNNGSTIVYYRIRILNNFEGFTGKKLPQPGPLLIYNNKSSQPIDYKDTFNDWLELNPQVQGASINYSFSTTTLPKGPNILEVSVLSVNAFKYLQSSEKANEFKDDFTSEKGIIFSNVKNGYGIVGGWAAAEFPFK